MSRHEQTLLLDMDGPLAAFDEDVCRIMAERFPDVQPLQQDIPHFYTANNYPEEVRGAVWAISNEPGFVAGLPPVEGVQDGLAQLRDAGIPMRICSKLLPAEYVPDSRQQKEAWLHKHIVPVLGKQIVETAVFIGDPATGFADKSAVPGFAIIEDALPPLKGESEATWVQIVFDRLCNRTPESAGYIRLNGWQDPALMDKIGEARERHQYKMQR